MAKFPNWLVNSDVSAVNLAAGIPNIVVKSSSSSVTNSTTLANDNELVNIALGVGRWWIKLIAFTVSPTTGCVLKTQWAFSGTWDTPLRFCKGPAATNTAAPNLVTPMTFNAQGTNGNQTYGLSNSGAYTMFEEETFSADVTVAGNFSLQYAQNVAVATTVFIQPETTLLYRQIA